VIKYSEIILWTTYPAKANSPSRATTTPHATAKGKTETRLAQQMSSSHQKETEVTPSKLQPHRYSTKAPLRVPTPLEK